MIPTWDDGPAFTDAGLWLWNGRTVEVNASCTLPEPPSPPDAVVRLDASTPAPDLPDPPPADAGPEAPEPDAAPPIPPPSTADAGPTDAGS